MIQYSSFFYFTHIRTNEESLQRIKTYTVYTTKWIKELFLSNGARSFYIYKNIFRQTKKKTELNESSANKGREQIAVGSGSHICLFYTHIHTQCCRKRWEPVELQAWCGIWWGWLQSGRWQPESPEHWGQRHNTRFRHKADTRLRQSVSGCFFLMLLFGNATCCH